MKMIVAFFHPRRLERVTRALEHVPGFSGMTVTEARGFGREKLEVRARDHLAELTDFTDAIRVEIVTSASLVDEILDAITEAARTGQRDDGKVFVLPVERGRRIRTGEEGEVVV